MYHERCMSMPEEQNCTSDIADNEYQSVGPGQTHYQHHHTTFMDGKKTLQLSGIALLLFHSTYYIVSCINHQEGTGSIHP